MPQIKFHKVSLKSVSRTATGGTLTVVFPWTQAIAKAMSWVRQIEEPEEPEETDKPKKASRPKSKQPAVLDLPDFLTSSKLEGDLSASDVKFVPDEEGMTGRAFELGANRMHKFEATKKELEGLRGKGHRIEVKAVIEFADPEGARKIEKWLVGIGDAPKGKLTVGYAKQEDLPLADEAPANTEKQDAMFEEGASAVQ